jgi:hypothetical protein
MHRHSATGRDGGTFDLTNSPPSASNGRWPRQLRREPGAPWSRNSRWDGVSAGSGPRKQSDPAFRLDAGLGREIGLPAASVFARGPDPFWIAEMLSVSFLTLRMRREERPAVKAEA